MNDLVAPISCGAFFISTIFFLRRAGYSWVAAGFAGLGSPIAFIVLYAMLGFPLSMLAGKLHIPERVLPQSVLSLLVAVLVAAGWCVGGFLLTRRAAHPQPPQSPN